MINEAPTAAGRPVAHPLDPLTADELAAAVGVLRGAGLLTARIGLARLDLREPPKSAVLAGERVEREALAVLYDRDRRRTTEVTVSLDQVSVTARRIVRGAFPAGMDGDGRAVAAALRHDPRWIDAMHRRHIEDLDLIELNPWPAGWFDTEWDRTGRRMCRVVGYVRADAGDNGLARPIEGVWALVDVDTAEILDFRDDWEVPLPPESGDYRTGAILEPRADLAALDITQPNGPSFQVDGREVTWQNWRFRVGFNSLEGLVLHQLSYDDAGQARSVLYRASLAEMVVPYGDPSPMQFFKNAFDVGETGLGVAANTLTRGCDCLGEIFYFDADLVNSAGDAEHLPRVVCLHEEDDGVLWRHTDLSTGHVEVRRSRRLVISFFATVGNYDYGFFWYLYTDATIAHEVKLTGLIQTQAVPPGGQARHGALVAPQLAGTNHQHFFCFRLDFDVDGVANEVHEVHTEAPPPAADNPHGNAIVVGDRVLATELQAQRTADPLSGRYWSVVNPHHRNRLGQAVGWKIEAPATPLMLAHPTSPVARRAPFASKHLWVTPYAPDERLPGGDYPNQHGPGEGIDAWTAADRGIVDTDVVVWLTLGVSHVCRPEDWPIMPAERLCFALKPVGFFERNPALDVAPSPAHCPTGTTAQSAAVK